MTLSITAFLTEVLSQLRSFISVITSLVWIFVQVSSVLGILVKKFVLWLSMYFIVFFYVFYVFYFSFKISLNAQNLAPTFLIPGHIKNSSVVNVTFIIELQVK